MSIGNVEFARARALSLPVDEVHIWLVSESRCASEGLLHRYRRLIPASERDRETRFRFAGDRRRYLLTRAAVRDVLSRYCDVDPAAWRFRPDSFGRPFVARPEAAGVPEFNLSHTEGLVACAAYRGGAIGLDAELVRPLDDLIGVARHCFAQTELAYVLGADRAEQLERFFTVWTLKESFVKALGGGLSIPLQDFAFDVDSGSRARLSVLRAELGDSGAWRFWRGRLPSGHALACSVQAAAALPRVRVFDLVPLGRASEREDLTVPNARRMPEASVSSVV